VKKLLIADLFCGAGGATEAALRAMRALGLTCDHFLAVNHWDTAIDTQKLNHPETRPLCESVEVVNPRVAVPGGRLHLLIAAPECTYFSTARGGRPVTDQQRTQPWVVLKWLQELYVENVLIENVPEFRNWGPIGANGKPLKSKKGTTYRAFLETIRSLGYTVEDRVLNAADYGDPTTRRRLFIIARRGKKPVHWPTPTHSQVGGRTLFGRTEKWRAAREVIDWSLEGQSIFTRKKPLSPKTMARVLAGLERFGGADLQPFLIQLRGTDSRQVANSARSLDDPLSTISTSGAHHALAQPRAFVMPVTHGGDGSRRERSVDEPLPTITGAHRGELAVCEPVLVVNNENNRAKSLDEPLPTTTGGNRHLLAEAFILQQQSGGVPRSTDEPLPTIATDGAQMLVEPFIVGYHSEKDGEAKRVHAVDEPLPTLSTENRFAVVEPFIVPPRGFSQDAKVDSVDQPLRTIVAASGHNFAVVEPFLIPHYGERPDQAPRTHSIDEPIPTIPASGDGKFEVVQPFIVGTGGPQYGGTPKSVDDPLGTVMTREHKALVEPVLTSYYGTLNVSPVSEPLPTVTTKDRFALVMPVVNGRALDIRLRMLKPHELARAMSFGDDYKFAGNQGDKVKQIGNAWPVRLGQALISAILDEYAAARPKKKAARFEAIA
jgi:DNA (cytosine-5)-methyltransferase 1